MWWPAKTADEQSVAGVLPRLQESFFSNLQDENVLGVGSFFSSDGLVPLLLLHERTLFDLPTLKMNLASFPMMRMQAMPQAIKSQLANWTLPNEGMALFVSPPEPAQGSDPVEAATGTAIRCRLTRQRGTLGMPLIRTGGELPWSRAFLTVGHMFPQGERSTAELIDERLLGPNSRILGKVVNHSNPINTPGVAGYDYAVIEVDSSTKIDSPKHGGCSVVPTPLTQPLRATVYGAVSGVKQDAAVCGALTVYGGPYGIWKNSWMLLPSGLVSKGDSGALLLLGSDQSTLGMLVGGSRFDNSESYLVQYAHDITSLLNDALRPAGYALA